jgi:hypothetical protein
MVERPDGNVVIEDDADYNCVEQERGSESLWKSIELYDNCLDGRLRDRRDSEQHTRVRPSIWIPTCEVSTPQAPEIPSPTKI